MREPVRITLENRRKSGPVRLIAAGQHGVVARGQLLAAGVTDSTIARALRSRALHRVYPGVYAAVVPELLTEEGQLLAALLGAGDGALLSHGTAAWRWGIIPAPPSLMQLALPRDHARMEGVTLFVSRNLRAGDITVNGRSPAPPRRARCWTSRPATATARCCAPSPRPSSTTTCAPRTSSARCVAGTPAAPTCWTVDCLWPDRRVAVELDGRQHERPTRPTQTTTATSGFAATAMSRAVTASARSTSSPTT